jgi:hypothetical protein
MEIKQCPKVVCESNYMFCFVWVSSVCYSQANLDSISSLEEDKIEAILDYTKSYEINLMMQMLIFSRATIKGDSLDLQAVLDLTKVHRN